MAPKWAKKAGGNGTGSRPSMRSLKSSVTKVITKARDKAEEVQNALRRHPKGLAPEDMDRYQEELQAQLELMKGIPDAIDEYIEGSLLLSGSDAIGNDNRSKMEVHLEERHWAEVVDRLEQLLKEAVRRAGKGRSKGIDEKRGGRTGVDGSESGEVSGNRVRSDSTLGSTELAESLSKRLATIQQTQDLFMDRMSNIAQERKAEAQERKAEAQERKAEAQERMAQAQEIKTLKRALEENTSQLGQLMSWIKERERPFAEKELLGIAVSGQSDQHLVDRDDVSVFENRDLSPPSEISKKESPILESSISGTGVSTVSRDRPGHTPMLSTNLVNSITSTITRFNGDPETYVLFRQMFDLMVHDNPEVPVTMKQSLLMRLLDEDVLKMMRSPKISAEDYQVLRDNLDRQYGKEDESSRHYIDLPKQHQFALDDFDEMEKDLTRFCTITNILKNNGSNPDDPVFLTMFVDRLPQKIMSQVFKKLRKGGQSFKDLADAAYEAILEKKALEQARLRQQKTVRVDEVLAVKVNLAQSGASYSPGQNGSAEGYQQRTCHFCKSAEHSGYTCPLSVAEREEAVKKRGRCFNCLSPKHRSRDCPSKGSCARCHKRHHTTICRLQEKSQFGGAGTAKQEPKQEEKSDKEPFFRTTEVATSESGPNRVVDPDSNLPFMVFKGKDGEDLLALVDCGASTTIVSTQTAARLKMPVVGEKVLHFKGFVADSRPESCTFYEVEVEDREGKLWSTACASYHRMNVRFTAPKFGPADVKFMREKGVGVEKLRRLEEFSGRPIDMIIGNNILGNIRQNQWSLPSGRCVEETLLGLVIYPPVMEGELKPAGQGRLSLERNQSQPVAYKISLEGISSRKKREAANVKEDNWYLDELLEMSWRLELLGLEPPDKVSEKEVLDQELVEHFRKTAVRDKDNKIYVAFPFNGRERDLQDNAAVALKRLAYDKIIQQQLESGIIEEVTEEMNRQEGPVFHIPHSAVFKESSNTTKLRIVFDASSHKKNALALNECIYPGPSILQSIVGILVRSRLSKFIMSSDIEKAFHQVRIQPECRNVTRFLWVKDIRKEPVGDNIVVFRFTRLPFGITCSPFLLGISIQCYLELDQCPLNEKILESIYVDNVVVTTNKLEELQRLYPQLKGKFKRMHMNLREFACNDADVMETIPEEDRAPSRINKFLGHEWNSESDTFGIKLASPPTGIPTKREVVAFQAKNYDPMGIISPLIVKTKILVTKMWELNVPWDTQIPEAVRPLWTEIVEDFQDTMYTIPRQVVESYDFVKIELIMFSDASKDMFGTVGYLRFEYPNHHVEIRLVFSKCRIRPCNSTFTIPQLELMGAECAVNAAIMLVNELHVKLDRVVFFTDNTCVLQWITNDVGNNLALRWAAGRVKKVRDRLTMLEDRKLRPTIRYVPTDQNPADLTTRGCSTTELKSNELWHFGPAFLRKTEEHWPVVGEIAAQDPVGIPVCSVSVSDRELGNKCENGDRAGIVSKPFSTFVPYSRTNSLNKLTSIVNYGLQFVAKCIKKRNDRFPENKILCTGYTLRSFIVADGDDDEDAEATLGVQPPQMFNPELGEDGLYRHRRPFCNSKNPKLTEEMKRPIIIIEEHPLAPLLVYEVHENLLHQGVKQMVFELQKRYWMRRIGRVVRRVRAECVTCRKIHARPFAYPYADALPPVRCQAVAPFAFIGLDYFGPLSYKSDCGKGKVWVLITTCLVTRAVHMELVMDNTTSSFITALGRVFARRGVPQSILSDNAPTFKLGYSIVNIGLKTLVNKSATLTSYLAEKEIDIKLITPFSPWKGGVYERLIAIAKNMIFKVIGTSRVSFLELESLIIEAEIILNSRPITPNQNQLVDTEAIRPVDYIMPNVRLATPWDDESVEELFTGGKTERLTRKLLEGVQAMKLKLWNRFSDEYYTFLRESVVRTAAHSRLAPAVGQVVLVVTHQRYKWPIGVIRELIYSSAVRSVRVKVGKHTLEKSVNHLVPLEVSNAEPWIPQSAADKSQSSHSSELRKTGDNQERDSVREEQRVQRTRPCLPRKAKERKKSNVYQEEEVWNIIFGMIHQSETTSENPVSEVRVAPRSVVKGMENHRLSQRG
uniref:Integrase catalytic domain-containing protein n=2 Tax=Caenorhabditis tropicalis TaxID=1561998 RepID=A0A1I7V2F0_9PELO